MGRGHKEVKYSGPWAFGNSEGGSLEVGAWEGGHSEVENTKSQVHGGLVLGAWVHGSQQLESLGAQELKVAREKLRSRKLGDHKGDSFQ